MFYNLVVKSFLKVYVMNLLNLRLFMIMIIFEQEGCYCIYVYFVIMFYDFENFQFDKKKGFNNVFLLE